MRHTKKPASVLPSTIEGVARPGCIPVPKRPGPGYVFGSWRDALADAQAQIGSAYSYRQRLVRKASEAGLSYREIAEALGLSPAGVSKIMDRKRASLDDPVGEVEGS
jgi:predicted XRE-type DNA-binding protein